MGESLYFVADLAIEEKQIKSVWHSI